LDAKTEQIINDLKKFGRIGYKNILEKIPEKERRYKCHTCFMIVDETPCPNCGETKLEICCPMDHCDCHHERSPMVVFCPVCGDPVCPECGSHDVVAISRLTGYLQDVSGYGAGKIAEMHDRKHYNPV